MKGSKRNIPVIGRLFRIEPQRRNEPEQTPTARKKAKKSSTNSEEETEQTSSSYNSSEEETEQSSSSSSSEKEEKKALPLSNIEAEASLYAAIHSGDYNRVKNLLEKYTYNLNKETTIKREYGLSDDIGKTFYWGSFAFDQPYWKKDIGRLLFQHGLKLDSLCDQGKARYCSLLLRYQIKCSETAGKSQKSLKKDRGRYEVFQFLLEEGVADNRAELLENCVVHAITRSYDLMVMKLLLDNGATISDGQWKTLIVSALRNEKAEKIFSAILEHPLVQKSLLANNGEKGKQPLKYAITEGNKLAVLTFLQIGVGLDDEHVKALKYNSKKTLKFLGQCIVNPEEIQPDMAWKEGMEFPTRMFYLFRALKALYKIEEEDKKKAEYGTAIEKMQGAIKALIGEDCKDLPAPIKEELEEKLVSTRARINTEAVEGNMTDMSMYTASSGSEVLETITMTFEEEEGEHELDKRGGKKKIVDEEELENVIPGQTGRKFVFGQKRTPSERQVNVSWQRTGTYEERMQRQRSDSSLKPDRVHGR